MHVRARSLAVLATCTVRNVHAPFYINSHQTSVVMRLMIGFCVEFRHSRPLQTSFGISKLIVLAAFSFSSLLALQREFRKLHSADGSKHSALNYLAFGEGLLSPHLALRIERWRSRLGAHLSPVISVSISYKLNGSETSIAKSLARASQK